MHVSFQIDIYRFNIERLGTTFVLSINNVISWDLMQITMTQVELKQLVDMIGAHIDDLQA